TTDIQGQSMENISDINSTYNIEVGDIKDSISLTNTISGIKLVMTQMGQEITFDSEKTEDLEGPIGGALKEVIKKPQAVTISKTGKVAPIPEGANEEENMILKQMGDFNASGYGASMAFGTVPENAKVGTTWTDATEEDGT